MNTIKNAIIKSTQLTKGDHNLLSAWLMLDYGGSGQGFGGHVLYLPRGFKHHIAQKNFAGHFIFRVMDIVNVDEWKDLIGKTIRVQLSGDGLNASIEAIGNIIEDKWFNPKIEFENL